MNLFISEENVGNDMKLIQADWKAAAEKFLSKEGEFLVFYELL